MRDEKEERVEGESQCHGWLPWSPLRPQTLFLQLPGVLAAMGVQLPGPLSPLTHVEPFAGPAPLHSSRGLDAALAVTTSHPTSPSAQSCLLHSPTGVVPKSSSQETCTKISSSESVSRERDLGRRVTCLVFLIGGQFLSNIDKAHTPMST